MTISKEVKIGLMVAVAVVVFFAGFYFLKGSSIFSHDYDYYAHYDNVQGLQLSAQVQVKGLQVGKVTAIELNGAGKVLVTISINKKTRLPKGTVAKLTSLDLLGSKGISLDLGNSTTPVDDEEELPAAVEGGLVDKLSVEVTPLLQDVRKVVNNLDSVLLSVNQIFSPDARNHLQSAIAELNTSMSNFSSLSGKLNGQSDNLAGVIQNAKSITDNIAKNNSNIDAILKNAKTTTDNLSKAPIEETVHKLQSVADQLAEVMTKINSGQGSIGMAVNDKTLYTDLNATLTNLSNLAADLKAHPTRYINLTVFGRKAKVGP